MEAEENVHEVLEDRFQHQSSLSFWIRILGHWLIVPLFPTGRPTSEVSRNFSEQTLDQCLRYHYQQEIVLRLTSAF